MTPEPRAWAGAIAGVIGLTDGIGYLVLINRQGEGESSVVVPFVFTLIAVATVGAFWGVITSPGRTASIMLTSSTILFFLLGVLGIFSIGLPLLVASALSLLAVFQSRGTGESKWGHPGRVAIAGGAAIGIILAALFLGQITGGGETVSVACKGSAPGPGMPSLADGAEHHPAASRPHPCRTRTSP
jgi:hypothetical protein